VSNVLIALGGNIGEVRKHFESACRMLEQSCCIIAKSKLYHTPALTAPGTKTQPDYLNAVIHGVTTCSPAELLAELHRIEDQHGRTRETRWGARTLDLDLLDYEGFTSTQPALSLPHPELHKRLFVLLPLQDVMPNWVHPVRNKTVSQMIEAIQNDISLKGEAW